MKQVYYWKKLHDAEKPKRNLELLKPTVLKYLGNFKNRKIKELKITFGYKGRPQTYTALTDVIFVVK
jgi:response regulator of citrate/malate metabolism